MIELAIRRPVATAAIYLALFSLGAWSFRLIPVEDFPDVQFPRLTVTANWGGASPEALEAFVTAPLESVVQQVGGVENVISTSEADSRGTGSTARIEIEFERDRRMDFARLDLSERIASIRDELPEGVVPSISEYTPADFREETAALLTYSVTGPFTFSRLAEIGEEDIAGRLRGLSGVSGVEVRGGSEREIAVELDPGRLAAFSIRPEEVRASIAALSEPRAPGSVELGGVQRAISVRTRALEVLDIEDIVVRMLPDAPVRVGDLGVVRDQEADPVQYWRINGQPTVSLQVFREAGTNVIGVSDHVKEELAAMAPTLPATLSLDLIHDQSEGIRVEVSDLRLRAIAAALVIVVVLMIFLRSLGAVLAVFATIGFSILIAVNFLYFGGFTLNLLTLAGLAWGFGIVVDNGIVVFENVERHRRQGLLPAEAASKGSHQVLLPVIAATLTTAIVLIPFLFLQDELRIYYLPLAFAVGFSILASLFVAFTFVPSIAARVTRAGQGATALAIGKGGREPLYIRAYRGLLGFGLDHPLVVTATCLAALGGSWHLFDNYVAKGFRWGGFGERETSVRVRVQFPRGAGLDRTDELARSFETRIAAMDGIERYETTVRPNYAFINVTFPDSLEYTAVPLLVKDRLTAHAITMSGVSLSVYGLGPGFSSGASGSSPRYSAKVLGYSYLTVQDIAEDIAERLQRFSRVRDVNPNASSSWIRQSEREFEYFVEPDRAEIGAYDLSVTQLLRFVSANIQGAPLASRLRVGGEEVRYSVKVDGYRDFDYYDLQELRIPVSRAGPFGTAEEVRLSDVADVGVRETLASIRRENQQYERTVSWEFRGPPTFGNVVRDLTLDAIHLPAGYEIDEDDSWSWSDEDERQLWLVLVFSILLIYMVTAGLFESLAAPFVVLFSLPFALIGVFLIFFYTDATFTDIAFIGTVMMGGIVVNNAILVVYHIGRLRESLPTREAIIQGTLERVRPILMTSLTTVFGLLPLVILTASADENIWNALALATIGGLLSSTVFVLVAIPVAYRYLVARRA